MELFSHERFIAANQELRDMLRRVEDLQEEGRGLTEDVSIFLRSRLVNIAPEVGDAARSEMLDGCVLGELAEYVTNLRALQNIIDRMDGAPIERRAHCKAVERPVDRSSDHVYAGLQVV